MAATRAGGIQSALSAVDIPKTGLILAVGWACYTILDTTADFGAWQLSFGSVYVSANDSRQVISNVQDSSVTLVTSGVYSGAMNFFEQLPEIPVGQGERIFLHSVAAAGVVGSCQCMISFDFDLDLPRARRR